MAAVADARTPSEGRSRSVLVLIAHLLAVGVVAGVGGWAASGSRETYEALELPPYAPPGWLFGPVWSVLYLLMALAAWRAWRAAGWDRAQVVYAVQLVLNLCWTPLFFAADAYTVALVEILALLVALVLTVVLFLRRDRVAGWLLVPYLAWVAFATALNAGIVVLN
ncbi:TspO/MBR family protein [Nocardioides sambongensis]|uniref:TspO/MBR family protein n=1 Tax=Nocardioides sambongensis TaxID=2589074 RepID=UPI0011261EE8|nr:TspO/MBR family protein [Nocardioides sambongensis]